MIRLTSPFLVFSGLFILEQAVFPAHRLRHMRENIHMSINKVTFFQDFYV